MGGVSRGLVVISILRRGPGHSTVIGTKCVRQRWTTSSEFELHFCFETAIVSDHMSMNLNSTLISVETEYREMLFRLETERSA